METDRGLLANAERFSGLAQVYNDCRPDYPNSAIVYIVMRAGLTAGDQVVDVGCGTGISTRQLAEAGLQVIGVEPNDDMRRQANAAEFQCAYPVRYLAGSAEATDQPDASARAVVAAQAFHWFKPEPAVREFLRILGPGGGVALMWNQVDRDDPLGGEYVETLARHSPEPAMARSVLSDSAGALLTHPGFEEADHASFRHYQDLTLEGLLGRARSVSYAPTDPAQRDRLIQAMTDLFARFRHDGRITLHYRTMVYTARKRRSA